MRIRALLFTILSVPVLVTGCSYDPSEDPFETFDRRSMLESIATRLISPGFDSLSERATALESAAHAFALNPNETTLGAAQQAWIRTGLSWKAVEMYRLGPLDNFSALLASIDTGAMDATYRARQIDSALVRTTLEGVTSVDRTFVESLRPSLQGIPVLELLLFGKGTSASALEKFTTDANAAKYRAYLEALSTSLAARCTQLKTEWGIGSGGSYTEFVGSEGRDCESSIGMIVNDMAMLTEAIRNEKLGRALGTRSNGVKQPTNVEAFLSEQSVPFMLRNLEALRNEFHGGLDTSAIGIDDLLDHVDAKSGDQQLSRLIDQQFQRTMDVIGAIPLPLSTTVATDDTPVRAAFEEVKKLLVLIKVDMPNNLGVMICYQDNDGD